jgi:ABC-type glutathione transport system ATPase component
MRRAQMLDVTANSTDRRAPLLRPSRARQTFYGRRMRLPRRVLRTLAGEVLAIVGESGSGKTTLLNASPPVSADHRQRLLPDARRRDRDLYRDGRAERRFLMRTDWGFVHQNPAMGLRMAVSAGANVGERLMAVGDRTTARSAIPRRLAERVEIDRAYRRCAARLFRRHAPAPADRPQSRHRTASRVHGRADRRPRRLGAGAPARPDARLVSELGLRPSSSPTISRWRGCCRTA